MHSTHHARKLACGLLALALTLSGCDSVAPHDEAPALISAEAFEMQTDLFSDASVSKTAVGENFFKARFGVTLVSAGVHLHLIIPAAVTAAALQADPVIEDGTWIWSSTTQAQGQEVRFTLSATPHADGATSGIDWSMRVSATDPETQEVLDDFELYTAQTSLDGKTGSWQLFYRLDLDEDGVAERTNVLNADFAITSSTEKELTFTVAAGPHAGASIRYARSGEARTFHLTQANGAEYLVTWNIETKSGSFTTTEGEDVSQGCWGPAPEFADVACTE